jgi:hypothetical protein
MRICLRRREFITGILPQRGRRARVCRISSEPLPALRVILAAEMRCGTPVARSRMRSGTHHRDRPNIRGARIIGRSEAALRGGFFLRNGFSQAGWNTRIQFK